MEREGNEASKSPLARTVVLTERRFKPLNKNKNMSKYQFLSFKSDCSIDNFIQMKLDEASRREEEEEEEEEQQESSSTKTTTTTTTTTTTKSGKGKGRGGKRSSDNQLPSPHPPPPPPFKRITPSLILDIATISKEPIDIVTLALRGNLTFQEVKEFKKRDPVQYERNLSFWSVFGPYKTPKPAPEPPENWFSECMKINGDFFYRKRNGQYYTFEKAVPYDLELNGLIDHTLVKDFPKVSEEER